MRVFETGRILPPKPKHSIQADVSDPDQRQQQGRVVSHADREARQQQWTEIRVDGVVGGCTGTHVGEVANHRNIRYQEHQCEQKPAAMAPVVGKYAYDKDGSAFKM